MKLLKHLDSLLSCQTSSDVLQVIVGGCEKRSVSRFRCFRALSVVDDHPVATLRTEDTEAGELQKVHQVDPRPAMEGTLAAKLHKVLVSSLVDALIRCHSDDDDLIDLNRCENGDPEEVEQRVEHHPAHPCAVVDCQEDIPEAVANSDIATVTAKVNDAAVEYNNHDGEHEKQEADKDAMILVAHVIPDPWAVVIEFLEM